MNLNSNNSKMRCRFFLFVVIFLCPSAIMAQHITEQQAKDRALIYINSQNIYINGQNTSMAAPIRGDGMRLESANVEADKVYAFNIEGGGFVIASADSRTLPVLGYSTSGRIDWDRMPVNMREWLKQYDEAVASLGSSTGFVDGNAIDANPSALSGTRSDRSPVQPLIKTHWNQDEPYYDQCPLYAGGLTEQLGNRCVTGCVSTSLAQLINYYRWPDTIPEGLPAYIVDEPYMIGTGILWQVDSLPPVVFKWDDMLDDYMFNDTLTDEKIQLGTEEQRQAVATLMRYCGQSIYASYNPTMTSAFCTDLFFGLKYIWGYKAATLINSRSQYSIDEWETIIYGELAAGRPILYQGQSLDNSGHSFICDGYDGNGFFHINWGWGGQDDGYFSLSVLNPYESKEVNEGSSEMGFNYDQMVIINTDPKMPVQSFSHDLYGKVHQTFNMTVSNGNTITLNYALDDSIIRIADIGLGVIDDGGQLVPQYLLYDCELLLQPLKVYFFIDSMQVGPGTEMKLYPMYRFCEPESQWQIMQPETWFAYVGRTAQGDFYIDVQSDSISLELVEGKVIKGTNRIFENQDILVSVKILTGKDYQDFLRLQPIYYGMVKEADVTPETPFVFGNAVQNVAYLRSGQMDSVTFIFNPEMGGLVKFEMVDGIGRYYGSFFLEFDGSKIANYEKYVDNNSSYSFEGDNLYFNVELCDKVGVEIPEDLVPVDSIAMRVRYFRDGKKIESVILRDEIREYLRALPEKGGGGDYKFTYRMPIDVSVNGTYIFDCYYGECIDNSFESAFSRCYKTFEYDSTGIGVIDLSPETDIYYDLLGHPLNGVPDQRGIYVNGNRIILIK